MTNAAANVTKHVRHDVKATIYALINPLKAFRDELSSISIMTPIFFIVLVAFFSAQLQLSKIDWESAAVEQFYSVPGETAPPFKADRLSYALEADKQDILALKSELEAQARWSPLMAAAIMPIQMLVLSALFFFIIRMTGKQVAFLKVSKLLLSAYIWPLLSLSFVFYFTYRDVELLTLSQMKLASVTSIVSYMSNLSEVWSTVLSSIDLVNLWLVSLTYIALTRGLNLSQKFSAIMLLGLWVGYITLKYLVYVMIVADCIACNV
ncbi:hypothetical protein [Alteromonas sp. BMJM2]|uniref:hypothetical protein n=1 Tax=Alteromonas sp. BMJM2 TaxID=2954241 RepID=UPI0022B2D1FF|nr:hypothetical protein [Alteromonas sp. BMJM2]